MAELGARPGQEGARRLCARATSRRRCEVWRGDEEIDAVYTSLFRELLTYMMEDPRNITFCTHLLFCAKNIERIGDHATNIAETVLLPDHRRSSCRASAPKSSTASIDGLGGQGRANDGEAAHPDRRGRGAADAAAALQSRSGGLRGRDRRRAATTPRCGCSETRARPARARLDAARASPASSSAGGCARAPTPSGCRSSC